jgi:glycosyltransferase involved in cell wall biosynthesis
MIVTSTAAAPPVSGADLRNYQNARALAQLGPVTMVSVGPLRDGRSTVGQIEVAALSSRGEPKGRALNPWRSRVEPRIPCAALPRLLDIAGSVSPDIILVEGVGLTALIGPLRPFARLLVLDMHNVESLVAPHVFPGRLRERFLPHGWTNAGRARRLERKALAEVDRVWVCSDIDRDWIVSLFAPKIPVDVVPNGIPRTDASPASLPAFPDRADGWPVLLLLGHFAYLPNVVAAQRLALEILPRVRRTFPSARVILAGREPVPEVERLASLPGVELVANPEDTSSLLACSHISVIPLSAGGGTRIKILEAMAWGLPVVATSVAAEGQGFEDGKEILIAETDEALAGAVTALCAEPDRLERQRRLAYEKTMLRYGPPVIAEAVRKGLGGV